MESTSIHIGAQTQMPQAQPAKTSGTQKMGKPKANFMEVVNDYIANFQSIKISDKVSFFRLLATMINAGISIIKALNILVSQTENAHMKKIIKDIVSQIE